MFINYFIMNKCKSAAIINLLSKKWNLLILKKLNDEKKVRFKDFINAGINPRILSARLKELESAKIISKKRFNTLPPKTEYKLTPAGEELVLCFKKLDSWIDKWKVL